MPGPWDPCCAVAEVLGPEARPGDRKSREEEGERAPLASPQRPSAQTELPGAGISSSLMPYRPQDPSPAPHSRPRAAPPVCTLGGAE